MSSRLRALGGTPRPGAVFASARPISARGITSAIALVLLSVALAAIAGCGGRRAQVLLHLTIADPRARLGAAPWQVVVFNPYLGSSAALLLDPKGPAFGVRGTAAPGTPFVIRGGLDTLAQIMDVEPDDAHDFGLALPSLRTDGYWRARLIRERMPSPADSPGNNPRPRRAGDARFCRWGQIAPDADAEMLTLEAHEMRDGERWELRVTIGIPARGPQP